MQWAYTHIWVLIFIIIIGTEILANKERQGTLLDEFVLSHINNKYIRVILYWCNISGI
jgi:hypothetical protein